MIDPQNGGGVQFVNIAENFDGQAAIETAAEMLLKDGSSKVAWPLKPSAMFTYFPHGVELQWK